MLHIKSFQEYDYQNADLIEIQLFSAFEKIVPSYKSFIT